MIIIIIITQKQQQEEYDICAIFAYVVEGEPPK